MDFITTNWLLISTAIISGLMLFWPFISGKSAAGISPTQAVTLINKDKAIIIDVRQPQEYASGHIKNSKNIPLDVFEEKITTTIKNKKTPLITVCASGIRAARALAIANKLGYEHTSQLAGGVKNWKDANLPMQYPAAEEQNTKNPEKASDKA